MIVTMLAKIWIIIQTIWMTNFISPAIAHSYAIFLCSWDVDDSLALPRLSTQWEWWAGWSGEILGVTTTLGFSRGLNMGWPGEFLFLLQQVHFPPGFPWHWSPTQASSTLHLGWVSSSWEMGWILPTWLPCIRWMGRSRGTFSRMTSPTIFPGLVIIIMLMVTLILMTKQCNIDAGKYLHWKVQKLANGILANVMTVGNTMKQSLTHVANDDTAMW